MNHDIVTRAVNKAMGRVRTAFRAVLTALDRDAPIMLAQAEGLSGEQLQDNELMQHYGYTSAPPDGAQMVVLPLGGKTAHGIIIATEHIQYRLKSLERGEVALYDDLGQCVRLTRTGIVIDGAGQPIIVRNASSVTIDTPQTKISGKLDVDGDITTGGSLTAAGDVFDHGGKSMSGMRAAYNGHKHGSGPTPDKAM